MKKSNWVILLMLFISLSACAPVVYETSYNQNGVPPVHHNHQEIAYQSHPVYDAVDSIEVTIYGDNIYLGVDLQPIKLVIYDGQYVDIPIKDKRGRMSKIYAHYQQHNLHFDTDRNCRTIVGASRYSYDKSWVKGHRYTDVMISKDYDTRGLQLDIRKPGQKKRAEISKQQENASYKTDKFGHDDEFTHSSNHLPGSALKQVKNQARASQPENAENTRNLPAVYQKNREDKIKTQPNQLTYNNKLQKNVDSNTAKQITAHNKAPHASEDNTSHWQPSKQNAQGTPVASDAASRITKAKEQRVKPAENQNNKKADDLNSKKAAKLKEKSPPAKKEQDRAVEGDDDQNASPEDQRQTQRQLASSTNEQEYPGHADFRAYSR